MKLKNKDLIMIGIIIGITLFFIGAIISNVFPSSEENLTSYKVSAAIKLVGMGFLTSSMVVGGIIVDNIDKNLKILLLLLGLILLIVYTVGAQSLIWNISGTESSSSQYDNRPTSYGIPGFEFIFFIFATLIILSWRLKRNKL